LPRAPSEYNLLGDSLVGKRIFSGLGGGGLRRSEKKEKRKGPFDITDITD